MRFSYIWGTCEKFFLGQSGLNLLFFGSTQYFEQKLAHFDTLFFDQKKLKVYVLIFKVCEKLFVEFRDQVAIKITL